MMTIELFDLLLIILIRSIEIARKEMMSNRIGVIIFVVYSYFQNFV